MVNAGCFTLDCACRFADDVRAPFPDGIPATSIYTRSDGVVHRQACIVECGTNVEVSGSHVGLAVNAQAYEHIAHALAA